MKKLFSILLIIIYYDLAIAQSRALVNQATVYEGDPVLLMLESDDSKASPDLGPLQTDFSVLGTSTSSQINIINGKRSYKKTWSVQLQPKLSGKITIPALQVGKDKTKSLEINVSKLPPEIAAETSKHVFLEASIELENNETYVQQQIPYKVKLFYDSAMQSGEVFSPKIENANIRTLGSDRKYQVVRAGKKYVVVEKHFVISPEKSGKLTIPPTMVKGRVALSGGSSKDQRQGMDDTDMLNKFFNNFGNDPFIKTPFDELFSRRSIDPSRPFTVSSKTFEVNVLPVPQEFTGKAWLPAEDLIMTDSWTKQAPELKVGEPVTRTLMLQVKGLASSQIPEIELPKPEGVKIYPERAVTETPTDGNTVYSVQRIEVTYIPNRQGKISIPDIKIDWWDVNNKKQNTFNLPGWTLNVAAGEDMSSQVSEESATTALSNANSSQAAKGGAEVEQPESNINWFFWVATLGVLMMLIMLTRNLFQRKKVSQTPGVKAKQTPERQLINLEKLRNLLFDAIERSDKNTSARLLLKYVRARWNDQSIQNLGILASQLASGAETIKELEEQLYAPEKQKWQGDKLARLVKNGLRRKPSTAKHKRQLLKPLYPV